MVRLGLNRWKFHSVEQFAAGVAHAETQGLDAAFLPVNPLGVGDPYVLMAAAAMRTESITLGTLLETPVLRPAAVAAGSAATLDQLAPGRTMLVYGIGDTAVRWLNKSPATVADLEQATTDARAFLAGESVDVGAERPAKLRHLQGPDPVPVWIAASGPRTLRMAGRSADGVFLRVGTHPANLRHAMNQIERGAADAGRDIDDIAIGLVVHTCRSQDPAEVRSITRAMAAGFYEYAPALFDPPGFEWNGPPIDELQAQLYPDFHHARDLVAAGGLVDFLPDEVADSFSFFGTAADIASQIRRIQAAVPQLDLVVPHPVPISTHDVPTSDVPTSDEIDDYARWMGRELKPLLT